MDLASGPAVSTRVQAHPEIPELDRNPVKGAADGVVVAHASVGVQVIGAPRWRRRAAAGSDAVPAVGRVGEFAVGCCFRVSGPAIDPRVSRGCDARLVVSLGVGVSCLVGLGIPPGRRA